MSSYDCSWTSAARRIDAHSSTARKIDAHSNAALVGVSGYSTARCGVTDVNKEKNLK